VAASAARDHEGVKPVRLLVALGAALAMADGSIVVLALPDLAASLRTTVEGAAAVIAVYTGVLAAALPLAAHARRRVHPGFLGAAGLALFAAGSLGCALAGSLAVMLTMRGVQGAGGAVAIATAAAMLRADARRDAAWSTIAIAGAAAGPALGGTLTQAFDWHAIFVAQVPIALAAAVGCAWAAESHSLDAPGETARPEPGRRSAVVALALVSASLTAVLFLLVFVLIAGWSVEPLAAAAALTVLPLAGLTTLSVRRGDPEQRAAAGALLIAGGVAALAPMSTASLWWTLLPQAMAGAGMGLALPPLGRAAGGAVRAVTVRHVGITVALALLAPLIAHQIDSSIQTSQERAVAALLDAPFPPLEKLKLAPGLANGVDASDPRGAVQTQLHRDRARVAPKDTAAYDEYADQIDATVVRGVNEAFRPIFLITAAFALVAALVLAPRLRPGLAMAGAAAVALPACAAAVAVAVAPATAAIEDPCQPRSPPAGSGIVERVAMDVLDRAACRRGISREKLIVDSAAQLQRELDRNGTDPQQLLAAIDRLLR
jgi:MFS family permease